MSPEFGELMKALKDEDRTVQVGYHDDPGFRAVWARLDCGHKEEYSSEHGGYDEIPWHFPSLAELANVLLGRVRRHDGAVCWNRTQREQQASKQGGPF